MTQKEKDAEFCRLKKEYQTKFVEYMEATAQLRRSISILNEQINAHTSNWRAYKNQYREAKQKLIEMPTEEGKWSKVRRFFLQITGKNPESLNNVKPEEL